MSPFALVRPLKVSAFSISALMSSAALLGQATSPSAPGSPASAVRDDEVVALSPFSVNADRDVGFVAASALAGGRLATDLRDTPIAYSVLTREFIDALNLTDVTKASAWAPNASFAKDDGRSTSFGRVQ